MIAVFRSLRYLLRPDRLLIKLLFLAIILFIAARFDFLVNRYDAPPRLLYAVQFWCIAYLAVSFTRFFIVYGYITRRKLALSTSDNFIVGVRRIASLVNFIASLFALLVAINLSLREVFTSLSIIAAALAILFRDYITNAISGMIVMFSDRLTIGDYVDIQGHQGKIVDITLMHIHLLKEDDDLIYVPNNKIIDQYIINYTRRANRKVSIEFETGYEYLNDVDGLERELVACLEPFAQHIAASSAGLRILRIEKDKAQLRFQYFMREPDKMIEQQIRRHIARSIIQYNIDLRRP